MTEDKTLQKLDRILGILLEQDNKFKELSKLIKDAKNEVLQGQDKIMIILKRLEENCLLFRKDFED